VRFKLQFRLKWFLLTTTMIAVLIGTVGKRLYDDWQTDAVAALEELGVKAERRGDVIVKLYFPNNRPDVPIKPRHFRMAAEVGELRELRLSNTGFADSDASTLVAHPKLKGLWLSGNPAVTDKPLKSIAKIPSLDMLVLSTTGVTDEGLKDIARLPKLGELFLSSTPVTSSGMDHLVPLQSLQRLVLVNTNVDDQGLAAIGKLRGLRHINLSRTKVRGDGIAALANLPNLKYLQLDGCLIEDGSGLGKLKQITYLDIKDTQIAPGVLSHIHEMDSLTMLRLSGTAVNDEQLVELSNAKQLTSLSIGRSGGDQTSNASAAALNELIFKLPNTKIYGKPRSP